MKTLSLIAFLLAATFSFAAKAQSYEVPKDYVLVAKTDYPKYEHDVIKTIDWLQATPWNEQNEKQREANAFFIKWVSGSPDVNVEIKEAHSKYWDANTSLMLAYMGGYVKYGIQHKQGFNQELAEAAGLKAVAEKYQSEKNHVKDKDVEKLLKN